MSDKGIRPEDASASSPAIHKKRYEYQCDKCRKCFKRVGSYIRHELKCVPSIKKSVLSELPAESCGLVKLRTDPAEHVMRKARRTDRKARNTSRLRVPAGGICLMEDEARTSLSPAAKSKFTVLQQIDQEVCDNLILSRAHGILNETICSQGSKLTPPFQSSRLASHLSDVRVRVGALWQQTKQLDTLIGLDFTPKRTYGRLRQKELLRRPSSKWENINSTFITEELATGNLDKKMNGVCDLPASHLADRVDAAIQCTINDSSASADSAPPVLGSAVTLIPPAGAASSNQEVHVGFSSYFESPCFADMLIHSRLERIPAHKIVLAVRFPSLMQWLKSADVLDLSLLDKADILSWLKYVYTGDANSLNSVSVQSRNIIDSFIQNASCPSANCIVKENAHTLLHPNAPLKESTSTSVSGEECGAVSGNGPSVPFPSCPSVPLPSGTQGMDLMPVKRPSARITHTRRKRSLMEISNSSLPLSPSSMTLAAELAKFPEKGTKKRHTTVSSKEGTRVRINRGNPRRRRVSRKYLADSFNQKVQIFSFEYNANIQAPPGLACVTPQHEKDPHQTRGTYSSALPDNQRSVSCIKTKSKQSTKGFTNIVSVSSPKVSPLMTMIGRLAPLVPTETTTANQAPHVPSSAKVTCQTTATPTCPNSIEEHSDLRRGQPTTIISRDLLPNSESSCASAENFMYHSKQRIQGCMFQAQSGITNEVLEPVFALSSSQRLPWVNQNLPSDMALLSEDTGSLGSGMVFSQKRFSRSNTQLLRNSDSGSERQQFASPGSSIDTNVFSPVRSQDTKLASPSSSENTRPAFPSTSQDAESAYPDNSPATHFPALGFAQSCDVVCHSSSTGVAPTSPGSSKHSTHPCTKTSQNTDAVTVSSPQGFSDLDPLYVIDIHDSGFNKAQVRVCDERAQLNGKSLSSHMSRHATPACACSKGHKPENCWCVVFEPWDESELDSNAL